MSPPYARVAVLGLGLVGGSLARLLQARGVDVVGQDVDPATVLAARAAGLAATGAVDEAVDGADLVVLAVPLRAMRATALQVARTIGPDATLTDVGSVKAPVRQVVEEAGLGARYLGAHPMAGTEHSGFAASSAALLDAAPWAVTVARSDATQPGATEPGTTEPGTGAAAVDEQRLARLLSLLTGTLGGTVAVLTDDVHDESAALISHVPHVLATQLLNMVAGAPVRGAALRLAAGSFRDGTRVARTDPARTEAMVTQNAAWVAPVLRKVVRDLEALVAGLETNAPVHGFFHAADELRGSGSEGRPAAQVPLRAGWSAVLAERCAAGAVVTAVTRDAVVLAG